jgi:Arc/MetJ family transcription regulator
MSKTLIDIDDELLTSAAQLLHTRTKKDTVNQALRELIESRARAEAVRKEVERAKSGYYRFLISD